MTDLHDRLDDLAGDAPAVLPESDLWLRGRRFRRSQQVARGLVASGLVMLIAVAGLSVQASGTLTPPLADAEAVLGLPDRIAAPSQHLRVTDAPGPAAAVIGAATHRTRLGEETLPVVISGVDGTAAFVRTPGARLDEADVPVGLSLSPDGRYLAYEVEAAQPTLAVLDLVEGGRQTFGFAEEVDGFPVGPVSDVVWSTTPDGDRLVWAQPLSPDEFEFPMPVLLVGNLSTGEASRHQLDAQGADALGQGSDRFVVLDVTGAVTTVDEVSDLAQRPPVLPTQAPPFDYDFAPVVDPQLTRIAVPGRGTNEDGSPVLTGRLNGGSPDFQRVQGVRADRLRGWRGDGLVGEGLDGEAPLTPELIQRLDLSTGELTDLVDIEVDSELVTWAEMVWEGDLIEVADESPLPLVVRDGILLALLLGGGSLLLTGIRRHRDLP